MYTRAQWGIFQAKLSTRRIIKVNITIEWNITKAWRALCGERSNYARVVDTGYRTGRGGEDWLAQLHPILVAIRYIAYIYIQSLHAWAGQHVINAELSSDTRDTVYQRPIKRSESNQNCAVVDSRARSRPVQL